MEQQAKMPPQMLVVIQILVGSCVGCIYVFLPALFLVFYQRESMRDLQATRSANPLDRPLPYAGARSEHPLRLVGVVHAYDGGLTAVSSRSFGTVLSGAAGAAVILFVTLVAAYLAWGTYRLQMAAWWGMLLLLESWGS